MSNIPSDFPFVNDKIHGFPWTEGTPPQYFSEKLPKITIITPSFNQGQFIEETIRSVLLQGYPNLEYIIIDGGSTDNTVEIIRKYETWITYWVSERDAGQSEAINKGAIKSTGELINWLNSDDLLAEGTLWNLAYQYINNPSHEVFIGHIAHFETDIVTKKGITNIQIFKQIENTIIFGGFVQPAMFYKNDVWRKLGGVRTEFFFCMDLDLWCRYLTQFGQAHICKTDSLYAYFRHHEFAKTTKHSDIHISEKVAIFISLLKSCEIPNEKIKMLQKLTYFKIDNKWQLKNISAAILSANIFFWIINRLHQKMAMSDFVRCYLETLKLQPLNRSWRVYLHPLAVFQRWVLKKKIDI
jgi:glycosyltransferase involved in cell wall biosynthesis